MSDAYHAKDGVPSNQSEPFGTGRPQAIVSLGRSCRSCGAESFLTGPGRGPHIASLSCVSCGAFNGWLSRLQAAAVLERLAP
jgi:hypothetical protein